MTKFWSKAFLVILFSILSSPYALSCKCDYESDEEIFKKSEVFIGIAEQTTPKHATINGMPYNLVKVRVLENFKGESINYKYFMYPSYPNTCDRILVDKNVYLIYAKWEKGILFQSGCRPFERFPLDEQKVLTLKDTNDLIDSLVGKLEFDQYKNLIEKYRSLSKAVNNVSK